MWCGGRTRMLLESLVFPRRIARRRPVATPSVTSSARHWALGVSAAGCARGLQADWDLHQAMQRAAREVS